MTAFTIRRLLWTIPVLLATMLLTLLLVRSLPGEPFSNPKLSEVTRATLLDKYGYNDTVAEQYIKMVKGAPTLDFGQSSQVANYKARKLIGQRIDDTMLLGFSAFILAAILGTLVGTVSALYANRPPDWILLFLSTVFFAIPTFVVAIYWIAYLPYHWTKLNHDSPAAIPLAGVALLVIALISRIGPIASVVPSIVARIVAALGVVALLVWVFQIGNGGAGWSGRIGPILVLALGIMPYFTRLLRASMIEMLHSEHVTAARSKGLPGHVTIMRHVLRNSLIPMVTNAGPLFAFVLTGSFIIEVIFNVHGIASLFVTSFNESGNQGRDFAVIMTLTVIVAGLIVIANTIVDIAVAWLDPRISHD